ncbi:MAG: ABC transporter ATP-binding protein [Acidobacteria bacterium]|nr:ABC transporter ATP-binding protein [Acidobacteriota bacterium]
MKTAITAERLTRVFAHHVAVNAVSFDVVAGEIFGSLGPNGAGKTTTARMLTGFITATSGRAVIAGIDITDRPSAARRHIGVVPEEANIYADLSVWDNVMLMAELHAVPKATRIQRANRLLERFDMADRIKQKGMLLSKGLRQRLMLCMALVSDPEILFLDEPTSGLDLSSAHLIRDIVSEHNRERGMTVFVTTHNMDEAERLCHRVAIIDKGILAAIDTPMALRQRVKSRRSVEVCFAQFNGQPADLLPDLATAEVTVFANGFRTYTSEPGPVAQAIAARALALGLSIEGLSTLTPTLEDVFLSIIGREKTADNEARPA